MANFTVAGYYSPGQTFTITNATAPVGSDTIVIAGITNTQDDWIKCGVIKFVGTSSTTHTYYLMANPEIVGQKAG